MSGLTECNYCSLENIKTDTKKKGYKVVMTPSEFMNGINVFIVPKHFKIKDIRQWKDCDACPPHGDTNYRRYHVSWFMKLPDYCVC